MSLLPRAIDEIFWPVSRLRPRDIFNEVMDMDLYGRHHLGSDPTRHMGEMVERMEKSLDRMKCMDSGVVPHRSGDFEVAVDVKGFSPEELKIDYRNGYLTMKGEHTEESPDGTKYISRSFHRQYMVPKNVDDEKMKSLLSRDGNVLRIHAPAKTVQQAVEPPKEIPIAIARD